MNHHRIDPEDIELVSLHCDLKVGISASLISLFRYNTYWTFKSYETFFNFLAGVPADYNYVTRIGWVFWGGQIGLTSRFAATVLGFVILYLLWVKTKPFSSVKGLVASALILESVYFVGLIPSVPFILDRGFAFLAAGYALQILSTAPLMFILAVAVIRFDGAQISGMWRWAGLASFGYIVALWSNSVTRWFDMVSQRGIAFLSYGATWFGFSISVALMSVAVVFAAAGAYYFAKLKENPARRWLGAALLTVGLYYILYVVYSFAVNALNSALLVDIWAIPLLALGVLLPISSWSNK